MCGSHGEQGDREQVSIFTAQPMDKKRKFEPMMSMATARIEVSEGKEHEYRHC
jgi:hypothetical protein